MQEYSKYRVITVGFILMFVFIIAAIYTNTKDVVAKKTQQAENNQQQNIIQSDSKKNNNDTSENMVSVEVSDNSENKNDENDLSSKLLLLTDRVGNLEKSVYSQNNSTAQGVRCNIRGVIDGENILQMNEEDAINESKNNGKEVLITCIFK